VEKLQKLSRFRTTMQNAHYRWCRHSLECLEFEAGCVGKVVGGQYLGYRRENGSNESVGEKINKQPRKSDLRMKAAMRRRIQISVIDS
jgi:hypothetical protein